MNTTSARVRYPWLMQIILTALGLSGMYWLGRSVDSPDDPIVFGIASEKTGWIEWGEDPLNWSAALRIPAQVVAIGGAIILAIVPLGVWSRRRRCKPWGLFCSRCHKDMAQEQFVALYGDVLVCPDCERSLAAMGAKEFVRLEPRRDET